MMNAVGFSVMRELKNIGNLQRVKVNSNSNLLLEGGEILGELLLTFAVLSHV